MRIIQISGKGRVGKTTLAHLIAKYSLDLGFNPVILPFADAIKKMAEANGITKEADSTQYREFCQKLGASRRAEDPDYWITRTYETIQEYMLKEIDNKKEKPNFEYVIIQDDVRYTNELAFGRDLVATQIFVSSDYRELSEDKAEWRNHESEALANAVEESFTGEAPNDYDETFDIIIFNGDGYLPTLEKEVKNNLQLWLDIGYLELSEIEDLNETNGSDS